MKEEEDEEVKQVKASVERKDEEKQVIMIETDRKQEAPVEVSQRSIVEKRASKRSVPVVSAPEPEPAEQQSSNFRKHRHKDVFEK